jgi:hypothetical protein
LRYLGGKAYLNYLPVIWKKGCVVAVVHIPAVQTSLDWESTSICRLLRVKRIQAITTGVSPISYVQGVFALICLQVTRSSAGTGTRLQPDDGYDLVPKFFHPNCFIH